MDSGIYVWKLDGVPKYVGQSIDINNRMNDNHKECKILNTAIKKYGYDGFEKEIICYCETEELSDLETYYIKELHTHVSEGGYNVSWGGYTPTKGLKLSEETKRKISISKLGKPRSEETIQKIIKNHADFSGENGPFFGKKHSEDTKQRLSEINLGKHPSEETKEKISRNSARANLGKHPSEETLQKMSESHLGKFGEESALFGKKKSDASSKYYGVYKKIMYRKYIYWVAYIRINGKSISIGNYKAELEAAKAYNDYVIENNLPNPLNDI